MSESEYELDQESSEEEFDLENASRFRLIPSKRIRQHTPSHKEAKPTLDKRVTRGKNSHLSNEMLGLTASDGYTVPLRHDFDVSDVEDDPVQPEEDFFSIFNVEISQFLWRRIRAETGKEEYLVKYKGRSYMHTKWLTQEEMEQQGPSLRNKINRFNKQFMKKQLEGTFDEEAIEEGKYFDSSYLEVDRILMTTEMFTVIHQKKANQIKGKWSESLMLVCSKLLNYTKNHIHYGVLFCEPVDPARDNCPEYHKIVTQPMDLGTILNKVYLDLYKTSAQFWSDVGLVYKNCLRFNREKTSDLHILGLTLRQCTIFLYWQWHQLSEQRFQQISQMVLPFPEEPEEVIGIGENLQRMEKVENEEQKEEEKVKLASIEEREEEVEGASRQVQNQSVQSQSVKPDRDFQNEASEEEMNIEENGNENDSQKNSSQGKPKENERKLAEDEEEERGFLDMEEFNKSNILLTEKKVELPQNQAQLDLLNPGEFSYNWLAEDQNGEVFMEYRYEFIDKTDMRQLDLNQEVDRLHMVKWKNLSYSEASWEQQSLVGCSDKINEFKNVNKALGKDARTAMEQQRDKHKLLVDIELNPKKKSKFTHGQLSEIRNKLYCYDVMQRKEPFQYRTENAQIYKNRQMLRSYQLESLNWLIKNWYQRRNAILADQMGLGKTIQAIAFLYHLFTVENVRGPFLIIAPLSTLQHWKRTVEEWTTMNCVLYYDQNGSLGRRSIQYYEWHHVNITMRGSIIPSQLNKFQILITSYQVFLLDFNQVIMNLPFQFIVVDEAHRLKNKNAKILNALKNLPCKRVLLLTGTPIQNNTGELWSLLNYIHSEKFTYFQDFRRQFGDLSSQEQVERLNKILKPYMLRRMKEDVQQSIPPLQETIIDVEMTNVQKTIYKALYEKNKEMLIKGLASSTSCNANLNNLEIQLRKCCNHPFLIKQLEYDLLKSCGTPEERMDKLISCSGKMVLVMKLLEKCKQEGKKVLIFSQFTHMLELIEQFLKWNDYRYERIDGQIKAKQRQSAIDRYNNPVKKREVFLLSTKAGGVGINLTSANVVIIYDSDWNPQNDVQATARAHRIGQKSQVQVYRLITCNTYETEMFERATQKLGLDKAIFIGGNFKEAGQNTNENKLSKTEMETLLKKGILGFLQNSEEEHNAEDFFNKDVDDIIQRNSRIAKYSLINGSCSFSKSRFVSENSDNDLKISDPNFWNIVLKNVKSQTQILLKALKETDVDRSLPAQRALMLQVSDQLDVLIKNKLSRNNVNTDDEINLTELLTIINSDRLFHKFYRDLASNWLEEIYKPSRRFKKFTFDDLEIPAKIATKKSVNTRLNEADPDNIYGEDDDEEEDQVSEDKLKIDDSKKDELLKKLCVFCEKPKCILHCKSFCKRSFHQACRQKIETEGLTCQAAPAKVDTPEMNLEVEALREMIDTNFVCADCTENLVSCLICKEKGQYYGAEYKKNKKSGKSAKKEEEVEQGGLAGKARRKNELTKCSTANCAKYFHPKCIQGYDTHKLFKYIDVNSMHFRCSLHYCQVCGVSGDTMSIFQCTRCPQALHTRCMDKEKIVKLSKKQFICENHFKSKKDLKKVAQRFVFPIKNLKHYLKSEKAEAKRKDLESEEEQEKAKAIETENQIVHGYQTRRNRHAPEDVPPPTVPSFEQPRVRNIVNKAKEKVPNLTYEQLGILPIREFNYTGYEKDWCRYCGSRYSSNFTQGPWGSKTLCTVHYINWKQTKILDLSGYVQRPQVPIDIDNDQELKFLSNFAAKNPDMTVIEIIPYLESKRIVKRP